MAPAREVREHVTQRTRRGVVFAERRWGVAVERQRDLERLQVAHRVAAGPKLARRRREIERLLDRDPEPPLLALARLLLRAGARQIRVIDEPAVSDLARRESARLDQVAHLVQRLSQPDRRLLE